MAQMKLQKVVVLTVMSVSMVLSHTAVFAQSAPADHPQERHAKSPEEMYNMHVKRLQALHDRLKITSSQEAVWRAFTESALPPKNRKPLPKPDEKSQLTVPERMEKRLAFVQEEQNRLTDQLAHVRALYATFSAEQKAIFDKDDMFRPFMQRGRLPGHHMPGSGKDKRATTDKE